MKRIGIAFACAMLVSALPTAPARANHIAGTYSDASPRGYLWLARFHDVAAEWVTSDMCNARETGAYERVRASTAGTSQFEGRWPSGLRLDQIRCDGRVTETIDIELDYSDFCDTHGCGDYGGENHRTVAPKAWCDFWDAPHPCGVHPSEVHLNLRKWNARSNEWRERLIMHETGHSQGLNHHCSSDSIMNDGRADCNGGRWTQVMGYRATDRSGVRAVYPDWRYR